MVLWYTENAVEPRSRPRLGAGFATKESVGVSLNVLMLREKCEFCGRKKSFLVQVAYTCCSSRQTAIDSTTNSYNHNSYIYIQDLLQRKVHFVIKENIYSRYFRYYSRGGSRHRRRSKYSSTFAKKN